MEQLFVGNPIKKIPSLRSFLLSATRLSRDSLGKIQVLVHYTREQLLSEGVHISTGGCCEAFLL